MYIYIYTCIYAYIHVYICIYIYMYVGIDIFVFQMGIDVIFLTILAISITFIFLDMAIQCGWDIFADWKEQGWNFPLKWWSLGKTLVPAKWSINYMLRRRSMVWPSLLPRPAGLCSECGSLLSTAWFIANMKPICRWSLNHLSILSDHARIYSRYL